MIDLILPSSQVLTEQTLDKGIIMGYLGGEPHGIIVKIADDDYRYSCSSNSEDWVESEEGLEYLIERITTRIPNISFKLLET